MNSNPGFNDIIDIAYRNKFKIKKVSSSEPNIYGWYVDVFEICVPNKMSNLAMALLRPKLEVLDVDAILNGELRRM